MKHNPENIPRSGNEGTRHRETQVSWLMNIRRKTSHNAWHVRSCPLIVPARKNFQMQNAGAVAERPVYVRFGAHPGLSAVLFLLKRGMSLQVKSAVLVAANHFRAAPIDGRLGGPPMRNRARLIPGAVQSRTTQFSCVLLSSAARWSGEADHD